MLPSFVSSIAPLFSDMAGETRTRIQGEETSMAENLTSVEATKRDKSCAVCGGYFEEKTLDEIRSHIEGCLEGWNSQDVKNAEAQKEAESLTLSNLSASISSGTLQHVGQDDADSKAQVKAENADLLRRVPAPSSSIFDEELENDPADTAQGMPGEPNSSRLRRTHKPWASERDLYDYFAKADHIAANLTKVRYPASESSLVMAKHMLEMEEIEKAEYRRKCKEMAQEKHAKWPSLFPKPSPRIGLSSSRTVSGSLSKSSPPERKASRYYPTLGRAYTPVGFSQTQRSASSSDTTSQANESGLTPPDLETDAIISEDELSESDLPPPFTSSTPPPDRDASIGEDVAAGRFKTLPNPDDFLLALTNPASRSTSALYTIAVNTQEALKLWQDEYLQLDARLTRKDPDYKPKNNPRELEDPTTFEAKKAAFFAGRKYKDMSYFHDATARARNKKISDARKQRERELEEAALALSGSSDGAGGLRRRLRKPRKLLETGLNETDTAARPAASRATSVISTRKRKRDGLVDIEEGDATATPSADTSPVRKRARPAAPAPPRSLSPLAPRPPLRLARPTPQHQRSRNRIPRSLPAPQAQRPSPKSEARVRAPGRP
ncbi:MAG: hypothetical protein FRX48_00876 [Lasallia pustulata]|uniref:Uncharacterized protein n=1 Tax=Lasallia pustulata TaxID=136370 RepID=A0A5M8Q1V4_9LECA|nr:MAG: hypothetical protein FRX48_00876 [Lasallia pustulata]